VAALVTAARELWEYLAGTAAGFAPAITVAVAPRSSVCPPGWAGIVVIGDAILATAPDHRTALLAVGITGPLDLDHRGLQRFLMAAGAGDVAESGIQRITSSAFAVCEHGQVVAAAGYRDWPCGTAHLSVLTAAAVRGRGLARAAASAAVAHAIGEGRLPQWRARPEASRRIARALGFRELGSQVSIRLAGAIPSHEC
jgi:hypothetical protein